MPPRLGPGGHGLGPGPLAGPGGGPGETVLAGVMVTSESRTRDSDADGRVPGPDNSDTVTAACPGQARPGPEYKFERVTQ